MTAAAAGGSAPVAGGGAGWFETVASEVVYEGWSRVRRDQVRMPDGDVVDREVVLHDDAVAVVPVLGDGTVVMLLQYRQPFGRGVLEIPAGKLDVDGEGVEEAAQRELREEIHYRAATLEHLATYANSAGWCDERTHLYLARGLEPAAPPDGFEARAEEAVMEVTRLPFDVALEHVRRADPVDGKTLLGLLLARERLR